MAKDKNTLNECLKADICNFNSQNCSWLKRWKHNLFSNPISEQKYIWLYIKALRHGEYYQNAPNGIINKVLMLFWLRLLRKYSHIINPATKIGDNCTLYPGVLIGHKISGGGAATIGNNVFIGAGTKIIGPVKIGDNVTIGQNCVITKDIKENSIVVNNSYLRYL